MNNSIPKNDKLSSLSEEARLVVSKLKPLDGRKRPRTKKKLINWIKSQCQGIKDCKSSDIVLNELIEAKIIQESGNSLTYPIKR